MKTIKEYAAQSQAIDDAIKQAESERLEMNIAIRDQFATRKVGDQIKIDAPFYQDGRDGKVFLIQRVTGRLWRWRDREPEVIIEYEGVVVKADGTPGRREHREEERFTL